MTSVRQVNKFPIYTTLTELNTYEVECSSCEQLKWPSLPKRPDKGYVCVLCRMGGTREARRRTGSMGGKASAARRSERKGSKSP